MNGWSNKTWRQTPKHQPVSGTDWKTVVKSTGKGKRVAKYHPSLSPDQRQEMELGFRDDEDFLYESGTVRRFFRVFPAVIGASNGQETRCVEIQHHFSGDVHGYPIDVEDLERTIRAKRPELFDELRKRLGIGQN